MPNGHLTQEECSEPEGRPKMVFVSYEGVMCWGIRARANPGSGIQQFRGTPGSFGCCGRIVKRCITTRTRAGNTDRKGSPVSMAFRFSELHLFQRQYSLENRQSAIRTSRYWT